MDILIGIGVMALLIVVIIVLYLFTWYKDTMEKRVKKVLYRGCGAFLDTEQVLKLYREQYPKTRAESVAKALERLEEWDEEVVTLMRESCTYYAVD